MLNYIAISTVPIMILYILIIGIKEKLDIFKLFIEGVTQGLKTIYKIAPYIIAITIAMGLFTKTGALNYLTYPLRPILNFFKIPEEIIPLLVIRPLSGGASTSIVMDIFKNYGPDSISGKIASIIMAGTETTFYTITILLGAVGIKKTRGIFKIGITLDVIISIIAIILVNLHII